MKRHEELSLTEMNYYRHGIIFFLSIFLNHNISAEESLLRFEFAQSFLHVRLPERIAHELAMC